jgi:hypothetical protein
MGCSFLYAGGPPADVLNMSGASSGTRTSEVGSPMTNDLFISTVFIITTSLGRGLGIVAVKLTNNRIIRLFHHYNVFFKEQKNLRLWPAG